MILTLYSWIMRLIFLIILVVLSLIGVCCYFIYINKDKIFNKIDDVVDNMDGLVDVDSDDENTLNLMQDCLTMLENQFNAPYRYDYIDLYGEDSLSTYELPDRETLFETFSESTNGGVGFRYSLSGENDGTGTNAPYVDVSFMKLESEPGNIRITTTLRDVMIK